MRPRRCAPPRNSPGLKGMDLAKAVSTKKIYQWNDGLIWKSAAKPPRPQTRLHVVAYDYGIKRKFCAYSPSTAAA